jgi:hypothetical protein
LRFYFKTPWVNLKWWCGSSHDGKVILLPNLCVRREITFTTLRTLDNLRSLQSAANPTYGDEFSLRLKVIDWMQALKINLQRWVYRKALVLKVLQFIRSWISEQVKRQREQNFP